MGEMERRGHALTSGSNFAEWSVPWSDLMMIMFMVFAMLFIYTQQAKKKAPTPPPPPQVRSVADKAPRDPEKAYLGQLRDPVRSAAAFRAAAGSPIRHTYYRSDNLGISVVRETNRQVRIFLNGDLFFRPGDARLAPASAPYLARLAGLLRVSSGAILVVGHTAQGEAASPSAGLNLSARRAAGVAAYFIRTQKLDPKRFIIAGRGAFQPQVPDTEGDAARRNRRVEVVLLTDM